MAKSVYSEVTSVSTSGFERDRVLDKLQTASKDLPYNVDDITISHNDFAVADVYNDSIRKLYSNYLFIIANAEIASTNTPISAASKYIAIQADGTAKLSATSIPTETLHGTVGTGVPTNSLSALGETFIISQTDNTGKLLYCNFAKNNSSVYETNANISSVTALLSGNEVEFNKTFKFKDVVSVDTSGNLLFVLDRGANTVYKFDITGLITSDKALKRTGITDSERPGRYLLKTIGGEGTGQTKNKLLRPNSLSVYNDKIYILDNGHNSIKVFDLNFNFLHELGNPSLFNNINYGELVSIVVDQYSDTLDFAQGYVLSSNGKVIIYDITNNRLKPPTSLYDYYDTRINILSSSELNTSFKKIVNSKVNKNILYLCNAARIYKYYKTNFKTYISEVSFTLSGNLSSLGNEDGDYQILSFDTTAYNDKEYIAVTTKSFPNSIVTTNIFIDEHPTIKLYNENFYTNYFTLSNILVLPQEVVNNITFNKTTKKLVYNHYSLFENLNKKIYSYYFQGEDSTSAFAPYPTLSAIVPHQFDRPAELNEDDNLYIGVNEPLLTDVINRPLKLLYEQQAALFDAIKETSLNTNPPSGRDVFLPGDETVFPNIITVTSGPSTVNAEEVVEITVTRVNVLTGAGACSFKYYTELGKVDGSSPAGENDFEYIDSTAPSFGSFARGVDTFTIKIPVGTAFGSDSKYFRVIIQENTNCLVDTEKNTHTVEIKPTGKQFKIVLTGTTGSLEEGSTSRVQIDRVPETGVDYLTASNTQVNVQVKPSSNFPDTQYTPVVPLSTEYAEVISEFVDFPKTRAGQTSAAEIASTSTITFTELVTSVVFDLSAVNNKTTDIDDRTLTVIISNPSENADLGNIVSQEFLVNDKFETSTLFLSDISASYRADGTSNTLLSCVNIWQALSADTNFVANSSNNPFLVNFTVNAPLSVFSVSTVSGALLFEPDHALNFSNNKFNIIVEDGAALVGKGGQGGHGYMWASGHDFAQDGTGSDDLSAFDHEGENGGFTIGSVNMTTYFNVITIANSGIIYGGAGGGGGGVLGVSASSMPNVSALSGGCGGGGGRGIHTAGAGTKGLAVVKENEDESYTQSSIFANIYLANGADGSTSAGGAGGAFTNVASTVPLLNPSQTVAIGSFPAMSGLSGGDFGEPGQTDSETVAVLPTPHGGGGSGFDTISGDWNIRFGGLAGVVVESGTYVSVTSSGTGITKGETLYTV